MSKYDECALYVLGRVSPNIVISMSGQLLLRYNHGDSFVRVGIPDFNDEHKLTVTILETSHTYIAPKPIWRILDSLDQDLWLEVTKSYEPPICFHTIVDKPSQLDTDPDHHEHDTDIQWMADFERPDFHGRKLPCDETHVKNTIFLGAGHFYTAWKNRAPLIRTRDGRDENDNAFVAIVIGANITLHNDGRARLRYENGKTAVNFLPTRQYQIIIENNPIDMLSQKADQSDFGHYYRVIKGVSPGERVDFKAKEDNPDVDSDDVPCMPGGSGFPPAGNP